VSLPRASVQLLATLALLAASAASAQDAPAVEGTQRTTVVVLDLEVIDVDPNKVKLLNGAVTDQLSGYEQLEIIAQADIRQMVDFEAEKQALGCDTSSCLSEIAGALGAGYVVFGRVGQLGEVVFVQLSLFDSAKGRAVSREEVRASDLAELPDKLRVAAARIASPLTGEVVAAPDAPEVVEPAGDGGGGLATPLLITGGVLAGLGVLGAVGGGITALVIDGQLGEDGKSAQDREGLVNLGWAGLGVAVGSGVLALAGLGVAAGSFVVE
jgi:TolB-like protein